MGPASWLASDLFSRGFGLHQRSGFRGALRSRPSAFANGLVVERASLARPTLSGWRHRAWARADRTSASSVERLSSNPATRSDGRARNASRSDAGGSIGVREYCAKSELHPRSGLEVLKGIYSRFKM